MVVCFISLIGKLTYRPLIIKVLSLCFVNCEICGVMRCICVELSAVCVLGANW